MVILSEIIWIPGRLQQGKRYSRLRVQACAVIWRDHVGKLGPAWRPNNQFHWDTDSSATVRSLKGILSREPIVEILCRSWFTNLPPNTWKSRFSIFFMLNHTALLHNVNETCKTILLVMLFFSLILNPFWMYAVCVACQQKIVFTQRNNDKKI
jgi:hypothetical protein